MSTSRLYTFRWNPNGSIFHVLFWHIYEHYRSEQNPPPPHTFEGYSASKWASERWRKCLIWARTRGPSGSIDRRVCSVTTMSKRKKLNPASNLDYNLELELSLLKYYRRTSAVLVLPNLQDFMGLVPLQCVVESMMRGMYVSPEAARVGGVFGQVPTGILEREWRRRYPVSRYCIFCRRAV